MVSRCRYAAVQVAKVKSHWCGCGHSVAVMVSRCWGRSSVPLSLPGTKESAFRKKAAAAFLINILQHFSRSNAILVDAIPHAEVTKRTDKTYAMQAESVVDETLVSMSLPPSCNRQNQTGYKIFAQKNESRRGGLLNPSKDSRLRRQNTKKKRKIWLKTLLVLSLTSNILL